MNSPLKRQNLNCILPHLSPYLPRETIDLDGSFLRPRCAGLKERLMGMKPHSSSSRLPSVAACVFVVPCGSAASSLESQEAQFHTLVINMVFLQWGLKAVISYDGFLLKAILFLSILTHS